jgi:hypothetical protein
VQTAVKYGSPDQRMAISKELQGRYIELARSKYGKFLVGKILEYGYVRWKCVDLEMWMFGNLLLQSFWAALGG